MRSCNDSNGAVSQSLPLVLEPVGTGGATTTQGGGCKGGAATGQGGGVKMISSRLVREAIDGDGAHGSSKDISRE